MTNRFDLLRFLRQFAFGALAILSTAPALAVDWRIGDVRAVLLNQLDHVNMTHHTTTFWQPKGTRVWLVVSGHIQAKNWNSNDKNQHLVADKKIAVIVNSVAYPPLLSVGKPREIEKSPALRIRYENEEKKPFQLVFMVPFSKNKDAVLRVGDREVTFVPKKARQLPRPGEYGQFEVVAVRWHKAAPQPSRQAPGAVEHHTAWKRNFLAVTIRATPKRAMLNSFANHEDYWSIFPQDLALLVAVPAGKVIVHSEDSPVAINYLPIVAEIVEPNNSIHIDSTTKLSVAQNEGVWQSSAPKTYLFAVPSHVRAMWLTFRLDRVAHVPIPK